MSWFIFGCGVALAATGLLAAILGG